MDKLERYILEKRDDLDRYRPDNSVWERIERETHKKKPSFIKIFSRVAVLIILAGLPFLLFYYIDVLSQGNKSERYEGYISSELKEAELYYTIKVDGLLEKTRPLLTDKPDLEKELMDDILKLDSICNQIKNDLRDNVSNQEVIEALILNYRTKVEILEEMLSVLEEKENLNPQNTQSHEL